jgi:hypothetical protein
MEKGDIELALIRTLSVRGLILGGLAASVRRERIRIAIIKQGMQDVKIDGEQTYEQAFWLCYGSMVELRTHERPVDPKPDEDEEVDESALFK